MYALLVTMLKLVVPMAVGYMLYKCRLFSNESNRGMSYLVVLVTSPCAMFKSIATMDAGEMGNALRLLWIGAAIYAVLIVLAWLIVKLLRIDPKASGVFQAALIFGNVGFLGLPLAESLFGEVGLFYMAFLNIHFTLLAYSYGIYLITRSGSGKSGFSFKKLINPGLIGIIVAAVFYFLQIPVPNIVMEPISFISNINSPLAMVVLGSTAAAYSLKKSSASSRKLSVSSFVFTFLFKSSAGLALGADLNSAFASLKPSFASAFKLFQSSLA